MSMCNYDTGRRFHAPAEAAVDAVTETSTPLNVLHLQLTRSADDAAADTVALSAGEVD
jgi:hypothetical protein